MLHLLTMPKAESVNFLLSEQEIIDEASMFNALLKIYYTPARGHFIHCSEYAPFS